MSTSATPSSPTPAGDDRNLVAIEPITFEDKVQIFWQKNRTAVFVLCALVLLGIVAKGGWEYVSRQKNLEIGKAYSAATTTDQLKAFSAAHSDHLLGGIAQVRIADEAYAAGKSAEALAAYDKVIAIFKDGPLASRAKIGRALAKVQSGKAAEATDELKKLADDANQLKAIRTEASYHLASLAVDSGNAAAAQTAVDQLMKIDPMSAWTQRAIALRATLPATPAPAVTTTPSGSRAPDAAKKDETPSVQVKVPGK